MVDLFQEEQVRFKLRHYQSRRVQSFNLKTPASCLKFATEIVKIQDLQIALWREASDDLGLEFISPFALRDGEEVVNYLGLLPEFGSKLGTLVIFDMPVDLERQGRLCKVAQVHGYGYSCIELRTEYDRNGMIEILNDWAWCGDAERTPPWYGQKRDNSD